MPDFRRPSQWWKAAPPGTPFRHPHSEQRRPARAHAVGPVQGPHARTDRTRDTRVAEPWLPAPEDGRPGPPVLWGGQPGFHDPCVPGAVGAGVGTQHWPHSVRPDGPALLAVGVAEGRPQGGVPPTIVRGVWCRALSLPRLPLLWSGQPGFCEPCVPGAVGAGVGNQHRPHSGRPCGLALLAVGVAEGRPRGGLPSTIVRGV